MNAFEMQQGHKGILAGIEDRGIIWEYALVLRSKCRGIHFTWGL